MKDKWGGKWVRISKDLVRRKSDGMIGGYFNGQGLKKKTYHSHYRPRIKGKESAGYKLIEDLLRLAP